MSVVQVAPGKWRARSRYRFDDGKLRQVERFAASGAKAQAALQLALTQITLTNQGEITREMTMSDLADQWLLASAHLARRTVDTYAQTVNHLIRPAVGALSVSEATTARLDKVIKSIAASNGPGAAKAARTALSGMLNLATRSDAVRVNPMREVSSVSSPREGAAAVPLSDIPRLVDAVRADKRLNEIDQADLVEFLIGTGCRIGESLGLCWSAVDLGAGTVTIRANVIRGNGVGLVLQDHPKTKAGVRTISVPQHVLDLLSARRASTRANPHDLVFPTVLGNIRDPRGTSREWALARERLGFPGVTPHSFRKSVATALDKAGLSAREIADYLGHANPSITQDVYMARNTGGTRAAKALDSVLAGH